MTKTKRKELIINLQGGKKKQQKTQPRTERKKEQQNFGSCEVNELVLTD